MDSIIPMDTTQHSQGEEAIIDARFTRNLTSDPPRATRRVLRGSHATRHPPLSTTSQHHPHPHHHPSESVSSLAQQIRGLSSSTAAATRLDRQLLSWSRNTLGHFTLQIPSSTNSHPWVSPGANVNNQTHPNSASATTPSIHPQFRSKAVCKLYCKHCSSLMCRRGMRAILLGNTKIELFSTDCPPSGVQLVYQDYQTKNCSCRIRDAACLGCGNVVGYHVTHPCDKCLESCNNGHFWMFTTEGIVPEERRMSQEGNLLRWSTLPAADQDDTSVKEEVVMR